MENNNTECAACGAFFTKTHEKQIYCPDCREKRGYRVREKYNKYENKASRNAYDIMRTPKTLTCIICGKEFKSIYDLETCGEKCHIIHKKNKITCTYCGKKVLDVREIPDSEVRKTVHFCSDECEQNNLKERFSDKICLNCGKQYFNANGQFCSRACYLEYTKNNPKKKTEKNNQKTQKITDISEKPTHVCPVCKELYTDQNFKINIKGKYISVCSRDCLERIVNYRIRIRQ